jgi:hypothetical protein
LLKKDLYTQASSLCERPFLAGWKPARPRSLLKKDLYTQASSLCKIHSPQAGSLRDRCRNFKLVLPVVSVGNG